MSPLQPKKVKKKKEREKLEQPPAIPAKGMKTETEVFQILSATMEGQQNLGQESCTLPLSLPVRWWEKKCPVPAAGTGCHLPADLAILRCYSMSPSRRSQLPLIIGERGTSVAIFTLPKEKIRVRQVEITCWGYSEGSQHAALLKLLVHSGSQANWADKDQLLWDFIFQEDLQLRGQSHKLLGVLSEQCCQCQASGREKGKDLKIYCGLGHKWSVLRGYACSSICIQTACLAYQIL